MFGFFFPRPRLLLVTGGWSPAWQSREFDLSGLDRVLEEDLDLVRELLPVFLAGGCSGMANSSLTLGLSASEVGSSGAGTFEEITATRLGSETDEVATITLCGEGTGW